MKFFDDYNEKRDIEIYNILDMIQDFDAVEIGEDRIQGPIEGYNARLDLYHSFTCTREKDGFVNVMIFRDKDDYDHYKLSVDFDEFKERFEELLNKQRPLQFHALNPAHSR